MHLRIPQKVRQHQFVGYQIVLITVTSTISEYFNSVFLCLPLSDKVYQVLRLNTATLSNTFHYRSSAIVLDSITRLPGKNCRLLFAPTSKKCNFLGIEISLELFKMQLTLMYFGRGFTLSDFSTMLSMQFYIQNNLKFSDKTKYSFMSA